MFVGRTDELQDLSRRLSDPAPQFVRVLGRRRIGKTELILEALREHPGLYLSVDEADRSVQLESLAAQVSAQVQGVPRRYASWDELLDHIEATGCRLLVLDEFQHLLESGSGAASRIQDRWDRRWKNTGPSLIVCGSSIGMMQRVASPRTGPLFGRFTASLHLGPMPYREVRGFYPELPEHERVVRYAIFGGTPFFHSFGRGLTLRETLNRVLLSPTGALLDEPQQLLREELRDATRYASLLYEVAHGTRALGELESKLAAAHGSLGPYLRVLTEEMDLLRSDEPLGGKARSRRYALADPFYEFYYRFVFPRRGLVASRQGALAWEEIEPELASHVGRVFEEVVRQFLRERMGGQVLGRPAHYREVGAWWSRTGHEVDVLAVGPKQAWLGEVQWSARPIERSLIEQLRAKVDLIPLLTGREVVLFVASRGDLAESAKSALAEVGGVHLGLEAMATAWRGQRPSPSTASRDTSGRPYARAGRDGRKER